MFGYRNTNSAVVVDGRMVSETLQCVHCGAHEEVVHGSGVRRGYCPDCKGFVCGVSYCMQYCSPFEARVEYSEALSKGSLKEINRLLTKYPHLREL
jgi:hypothetical protein